MQKEGQNTSVCDLSADCGCLSDQSRAKTHSLHVALTEHTSQKQTSHCNYRGQEPTIQAEQNDGQLCELLQWELHLGGIKDADSAVGGFGSKFFDTIDS